MRQIRSAHAQKNIFRHTWPSSLVLRSGLTLRSTRTPAGGASPAPRSPVTLLVRPPEHRCWPFNRSAQRLGEFRYIARKVLLHGSSTRCMVHVERPIDQGEPK